jgi:hypothetical protein
MTVPQETEPYEAPGFEKLTFIPEAGQESRSSGVRVKWGQTFILRISSSHNAFRNHADR